MGEQSYCDRGVLIYSEQEDVDGGQVARAGDEVRNNHESNFISIEPRVTREIVPRGLYQMQGDRPPHDKGVPVPGILQKFGEVDQR